MSFGELEEEYLRKDTTYIDWKLAIHKAQLGKLTEEDGPPFSIDLFRHYLKYTYMSCKQVGGVEVPNLASIGTLVLASNIQMYEPRPFNYATYLVEKLHEGFLNPRDNQNPIFKFYSLLMHLIMFYGHISGLWLEDLKLNTRNREGEKQPAQMWTSLWDSRYMRSNYIKFEELILKPLFKMYGVPCEGSIS